MNCLRIEWRRIPVCFPFVPLGLTSDPEKETDAYFRSKSALICGNKNTFTGVQIRVNQKSGRGVLLDYYGCSIYDQIITLDKIINAHIMGMEDVPHIYSRQHTSLIRLFAASFQLAYCILFEDLTTKRSITADLKKKGIEIFGTTSRFEKWLSSPHHAMDQKTPREVLKSGLLGLEIVSDALVDLEPWTEVELQFMLSRKNRINY